MDILKTSNIISPVFEIAYGDAGNDHYIYAYLNDENLNEIAKADIQIKLGSDKALVISKNKQLLFDELSSELINAIRYGKLVFCFYNERQEITKRVK